MNDSSSFWIAYVATAALPHSASFSTILTASPTLTAGPRNTTFDTGNTSSEDAASTDVSTMLTGVASFITLSTP